jgi:hypothetical protein
VVVLVFLIRMTAGIIWLAGRWKSRSLANLLSVSGFVGMALYRTELSNVQSMASQIHTANGSITAGTGYGLWVLIAGAFLALVASVALQSRRPARVRV